MEETKWAFAAFGVPKKNGEIRLVIDFWLLNEHLERSEYPLPTIQDTLQSLMGFDWIANIDLNMGYMAMRLDEASRKTLRIITQYEVFKCLVPPQGIKPATNIFQGQMASLFYNSPKHLPVYLDDILNPTKGTFDTHLVELDNTLPQLGGLQVNAEKSNWAAPKNWNFWDFGLRRKDIGQLRSKLKQS